MFADQASRLLREQWTNVTDFASELVAMFQDSVDVTHRAGMTFKNTNANRPTMVVQHANTGGYVLQVQDANENVLGGLVYENGDLVFRSIPQGNSGSAFPGQSGTVTDSPDIAATPPSNSGKVFLGRVVSGAATLYVVTLYVDGANTPGTTLQVTANLLNGTPVLAVNEWVGVVQANEEFHILLMR